MNDKILEALQDIVGIEHVLDSARVSERATHFWDANPLIAGALIRPANTSQVSDVLKLCHANDQVVVTHGGVTGLVDGNRSTSQDIILSLERQRQIEAIDPIGRTITVGAGAILQDVQQAAADVGLQLGLDLGARGSCTIGGNVSTNAGGLSVLRYGMAREQVLGLEAVLADGTIVSSMNRMMKNNAGYDLKQLFIGSEGTLGIITRVVLRLRAATPVVQTALLAFKEFDNVVTTLGHLDNSLNGTLDAFEVIWQPFYKLNTEPSRSDTVSAPLSPDYPLYAIVEAKSAAGTDNDTAFNNALEQLMEENVIVDAVVAQSKADARNIWYIREHIDIALEHNPVFVYDISLPIADMERYVEQLERQVESCWPGCTLYVYGHLADGNLHILVAPPEDTPQTDVPDSQHADSNIASGANDRGNNSASTSDISTDHYKQWRQQSNTLVYAPLQAMGGSVSAEHGIGLQKKPYLDLSRNAVEISLMKTLKRTLDPKGILNRGKIIDIDSSKTEADPPHQSTNSTTHS